MTTPALCMLVEGLLSESGGVLQTNITTTLPLPTTTAPNVTVNSSSTEPHDAQGSSDVLWDIQDVLRGNVVPVLCSVGLLGNIVNLVVFLAELVREDMLPLQKSNTAGLASLAACDLLFCLLILFGSWIPENQAVYTQRGFVYGYHVYGPYLQEVLLKVSTWLTVITALSRYAVIRHPIRTRQLCRVKYILLAVILTWITWSVLEIPILWTFHGITLSCDSGKTYYVLDTGVMATNKTLRRTLTVVWAVLGFFLPVCILLYCNVCFILMLRKSSFRRSLLREDKPVTESTNIINCTLVLIIVMFFVCVCPSEILHLYLDLAQPPLDVASLTFLLMCTNTLQAINVSFNFALYCAINKHFRKMILHCMCCQTGRLPNRKCGQPGSRMRCSQRPTLTSLRSPFSTGMASQSDV